MADESKPKSQSFASAARLGAKAARLAAKLKAERAEAARMKGELDELKKNPTPADMAEKLARAEGTIRDGRHKAAFAKLAAEAKVRPDAIDDLYSLSGYKAEGDEPDAKAIGTAIGKALETRPFLVGDGKEAPASRRLERGAEGDRGGKSTDVGRVRYSMADVADPTWQARNHVQFNADVASGKAAFVD